ncbi:hypothetical protein [Actinokineospora sp.]|uniref:hypothetical protein n=1 Tax=Actinokineospora sp. TaxID=1872133 RepID=UPI003D6BD9E0
MSTPVIGARSLSRTAPDGGRLSLVLPEAAGEVEWFGATRFAGGGTARDFSFAEVGQYRVIPKKIFPGGQHEVFRRTGFDLHTFEAANRTDSCLVWVGPHSEMTTWFGGPLPRTDVLNRLVSSVRFTDSPTGATVSSHSSTVQQHTTILIAQNDRLIMMFRDARSARPLVPEWQGLAHGDGELWRTSRALDADDLARVRGTALEWRYHVANPTAYFDVSFHAPHSVAALDAADVDALATAVLDGTRASWSH